MIFKVYSGAVDVVAAGTIGRGPLDHHVPSGPVSRLPGPQKPIIFDKFCKNLKVPPMGELRSQLGARKLEGQVRSKSHYQNFEIENF